MFPPLQGEGRGGDGVVNNFMNIKLRFHPPLELWGGNIRGVFRRAKFFSRRQLLNNIKYSNGVGAPTPPAKKAPSKTAMTTNHALAFYFLMRRWN